MSGDWLDVLRAKGHPDWLLAWGPLLEVAAAADFVHAHGPGKPERMPDDCPLCAALASVSVYRMDYSETGSWDSSLLNPDGSRRPAWDAFKAAVNA